MDGNYVAERSDLILFSMYRYESIYNRCLNADILAICNRCPNAFVVQGRASQWHDVYIYIFSFLYIYTHTHARAHTYIYMNQELLGANTKPLRANPCHRLSFLPPCVPLVLCRGSDTSSSAGSRSRAVTEAGADLHQEVTRLLGKRGCCFLACRNHPRGVVLDLHGVFCSWKAWGISARTSLPTAACQILERL